MGLNAGWAEGPVLKRRFLLLALAAAGIFLLLALRLWQLQLLDAERYRDLSEKNRIRYVPMAAPRGSIYDRDGHLLVDTRPAFDISALRQEVEDPDRLIEQLGRHLGVERGELLARWQKGSRYPAWRPVPLAEDVGRAALEVIQEHGPEIPGVFTEVRPVRSYPYGELAAHLLGYLGEVTERELQQSAFAGYRSGEFVGKSGLEKTLERYLRGTEGQRRVEVDVRGRELRLLEIEPPVAGNRVFLTLRRDVQEAAEKAFGEEAGAAVALDVKTGEVLALVSRPAFPPALFARGITGPEWIDLLQNPRHPLQDKAIRGQYPPGSTFKTVIALAALEAGVATPSTTVNCQGSFRLGNRQFRCWKKSGHGAVDLKRALKESCDVWFYKVGLELGIDRIAATSRAFGLGAPLQLGLEGEKGGLIPDRDWKRRRFGAPWYDGETVNASIGQGYVLMTPLQLASMAATVANGGKVMRPHLVQRIEDLQGNLLLAERPEVAGTVKLRPSHLDAVRRGLEAVVNEPGGTAYASRLPQVRMAGKTGTAQVVKLKDDKAGSAESRYEHRDHALFVAYAPADDPQIAVAVVVEHGGHGGSAAAPIARAAIAAYLGIDLAPPPPPKEEAAAGEAADGEEAAPENPDVAPAGDASRTLDEEEVGD
jgi:penicillin-binding protein 2